MTDATSWLPELITLADAGGDWNLYREAIYAIFCRDFLETKPIYPGKRFAMKRHPMALGKEATFWHLIQEGPVEEHRVPDFRRCERIRWPRPMIEGLQSGQVRVWKNIRGQSQRVVIAVSDFSYVVILDERDDFVLLWTAYFVERQHQRDKLAREFAESQKAGSGNS
jgi:hypothetical protein